MWVWLGFRKILESGHAYIYTAMHGLLYFATWKEQSSVAINLSASGSAFEKCLLQNLAFTLIGILTIHLTLFMNVSSAFSIWEGLGHRKP